MQSPRLASRSPRLGTSHVEIVLVRHAETTWNLEGRVQGHRQSPLSGRGVRQARALSAALARLQWDAAYSSDLVRAVQTARCVVGGVPRSPLILVPGLRERGQGLLEGMTSEEVERLGGDLDAPELGREPASSFADRCVRQIDQIVARHPGGAILVITHGGVIRALRSCYARCATDSGCRAGAPAHPPRNASISVLRCESDRRSWVRYDDISHLGDHASPARTDVIGRLMTDGGEPA